jgi:translation elongation factor EF-Tu-like GTPase
MTEQFIGTVTHYFKGPGVAVVQVTEGELHQGDQVHIVGHTSDFTEEITSMEVDHQKVDRAGAGDEVAVEVVARVRQHDTVFRITEG